MKEFICNSSEAIHYFNHVCTSGGNTSQYECFKFYNNMTDTVRQIAGAWLLILGTVGILGNLTTLLTIPYAANKKRHGLDKTYCTTTIFILHFSFIDLLHCIFIVVPQGILYSSESSPFGIYGCKLIIYGGVVTLVADMLAIAIVALSRCMDMVMHQKWAEFCDKKRNITTLLLIAWVPGLISLLISFIIEWHGVVPGWNCETGGCGFVRSCRHGVNDFVSVSNLNGLSSCESGLNVWRLSYFSTIIVPTCSLLVISISYVVIRCKVHTSTKYFADQQINISSLSQRDIKLTQTILILVVLNFICWLPYVVLITAALDLTSPHKPSNAKQYILKVVLVCMFESQYALNFFVYVARSEQYRNAFLDILPIFGMKRQNSRQSNKGTH